MTQRDHILKLIQDAGSKGISSNELRNITHAVDVPKCVSDLNKLGCGIDSAGNGDGTVTYFLRHQPIKEWVLMPSGNCGWVVKGYKTVTIKPRKKHKNYAPGWQQWVAIDPMTGRAA